ncbi:MAG: S9 family peptidase [Actinomycetota bacterium]|nr:S9 family peptidase [Actinomycetota bacterium]
MPGMTPSDLYELTWSDDPRLSPDGKWVAYVVTSLDADQNDYPSAIWVAGIDGSAAPRQVTTGTKRDTQPRWSPDGTKLAFTSTRDKDATQLYVLEVDASQSELDGSTARRLTDLEEDVSGIKWSPDGTRIAFEARDRDPAYAEEKDARRSPRRITRLQYKLDNVGWTTDRRQHIFIVDVSGDSALQQLTHGDFEDADPDWSPDGSRIAFVSGRHDDWDIDPHVDVYVAPAEGGEPQLVAAGNGIAAKPIWSEDGSWIAFEYTPDVWNEPHHGQIAVVSSEGGQPMLLTKQLDRNCAVYPPVRGPQWSGDSIFFLVEDHGNVHLYRVERDGSQPPRAITEGDCWIGGFDVTTSTTVTSRGEPLLPGEIFVEDRMLTRHSRSFTAGRQLVTPERFTAKSADGTEVECWIVRPVDLEDGKKYPTLLAIHGGPFTQFGNKFFDEFQVYAAAGYAVVYCNPRGSSGYSEEWGRAIRGPVVDGPGWGTVDYEDVMAAIDTAVEQFEFCDGERLGVLGGSYGGYMTSWIVSHNDRFKAACSERAVNNFLSEYGSSDMGWWFKAYVGASAFEDPQTMLDMSPSTYAGNIRTPLLILHSENDLRCNVEQAEHLFTTLRLLKREVEFVRFPGESHELSRSGSPIHRVMRFECLLEWFDRYLK